MNTMRKAIAIGLLVSPVVGCAEVKVQDGELDPTKHHPSFDVVQNHRDEQDRLASANDASVLIDVSSETTEGNGVDPLSAVLLGSGVLVTCGVMAALAKRYQGPEPHSYPNQEAYESSI